MDMHWRNTNDLDLSIVAEPGELAEDLRTLGWTRSARLEQRWTSPHGVLVDVLPATPADLARGTLTFPESGQVMRLAGFDLALAHCVRVPLEADTWLEVATVAVIVVLKMAAWLDRPAERDRDLDDLAHVLDEYLASDDMRRWESAFIDAAIPYDDQSAFALGQDVGAIASGARVRMVDEFLHAVSDESSARHARFARYFGPAASSELLSGRLRAFQQGYGRVAPPT